VLTKDLLRVSRAGGGYHPQFASDDDRQIAARVIGCYQGHIGEPRHRLDDALTDIERDSEDFKLVRGFAKLLDREAVFETRAAVDPGRAREVAFERAESVGVVTDGERTRALQQAAERLDATPDAVADSLYADRDQRRVLVAAPDRFSPDALVAQYNLSLAQTALFDATEVRVRSSDPKGVISAVKRLRLMYEVRRLPASERRTVADADREIVVTGPDALFAKTRRYGTRFARLLRTVAGHAEWELAATVDDRGTERELTLSDGDVSVPGTDPVAEVTFDSGVEADFAARFSSLDLEWDLGREPDAVAAGEHVVVPDFAFDWKHGVPDVANGDSGAGNAERSRDFRVYFEIMGFWTPEYVRKKLSRLADVDDVEMLVAVDESLGVADELEARDHRAVPYSKTVRVKDVRDALRHYEEKLVADAAEDLPDELRPDADAVTLTELADSYGVSERAIEDKSFPDHERVGRTLVRPGVLAELREEIEVGMALSDGEAVLDEYGIGDASAALSELGYRVAWEGLSGGTVQEKSDGTQSDE
jgi:predicted nuclease of restriction endonuclease-like RecB superfamily